MRDRRARAASVLLILALPALAESVGPAGAPTVSSLLTALALASGLVLAARSRELLLIERARPAVEPAATPATFESLAGEPAPAWPSPAAVELA